MEVMKLPFISAGGISYEGVALYRALLENPKCPTTGVDCRPRQSRFNEQLYEAINAWKLSHNVPIVPQSCIEHIKDAADPRKLFRAIEKHDLIKVQQLVEVGADLQTTRGSQNWTPLHVAVDEEAVGIVRFLACVNIDCRGSKGETPLTIAAQKGFLEIAKILVGRGASVNCLDGDRISPLCMACQEGHLHIVRFLVDCGAKLTPLPTVTPLMCAVMDCHITVMRYLHDVGVDVNEKTPEDGDTALHQACSGVDAEPVEFLLERGAHVDTICNTGRLPIHVAALHGNLYAVSELLKRGTPVDVVEKSHGNTALMLAVDGEHLNIVDYLITHGADVNFRNRKKQTPLFLACCKSNAEIARRLIRAGANIASPAGKCNSTPLHAAAHADCVPIVQRLIVEGADVEAEDSEGSRPYHETSSVEIIRLCGKNPRDFRKRPIVPSLDNLLDSLNSLQLSSR